MMLLQRLLREPLFHFTVIGALIFGVFAALNETDAPPSGVIIISAERSDQLASEFESVWKRRPAGEELDALVEEEIREEVYYREAIALGLDKNDALVRRRMRLKMEFLMDSTAHTLKPAEGELEAYLAANAENYLLESRVAFEQIYLGEDPSAEALATLLDRLRSDPALDRRTLGERTMLPGQLGLSTTDVVSGVFGKGFAEQFAEVSTGEWFGPVTSTYGLHLVRLLDVLPARPPVLEEVYDDVSRDWMAEKAGDVHDRDYAERRSHFTIEIHRSDAEPEPMQ
jgi:hypothetical protein